MTVPGPGQMPVRAPRLDEPPDSTEVMDGLFLSLWQPPPGDPAARLLAALARLVVACPAPPDPGGTGPIQQEPGR